MADYRKSQGKRTNVKCRVCKKEIIFQNYKEHIRSQHENEDYNVLRSSSQTSLQTIFTKQSVSKKKEAKMNKDIDSRKYGEQDSFVENNDNQKGAEAVRERSHIT